MSAFTQCGHLTEIGERLQNTESCRLCGLISKSAHVQQQSFKVMGLIIQEARKCMDSLNKSLKNTLALGIGNNSIAILVVLYFEYLMQTRGEATGEGMIYAFSLFPIQVIFGIINTLLLLWLINSIVFLVLFVGISDHL